MRKLAIAVPILGIAVLLAGLAWGRKSAPPRQPIAFDHNLHLKQGLNCTDCHVLVETSQHAGLPTANLCMTCHAAIKTDSPEVQKIAAFQKDRQPIPWVRLYQVPDFVYFNHARHVKNGLKCAECHGTTGTVAVSASEKEFAMATCMDCHRARNAPNDCITCHQ